MALQREKFLVYVQDEKEEVTEHQVTIHHVDMLRGELENSRRGNPDGARLNLVTCWCWAALTRLGKYTKGYEHFLTECLGLDDDGQETVDPTQPGTPEGSG